MKRLIPVLIGLLVFLTACTLAGNSKPADAVEISIIYAPESESYLKDAMAAFNQSFAKGDQPGHQPASGQGRESRSG